MAGAGSITVPETNEESRCSGSEPRTLVSSSQIVVRKMARPKGFEPLTPRFVVWCSIQLSYGRFIGRLLQEATFAEAADIEASDPLGKPLRAEDVRKASV